MIGTRVTCEVDGVRLPGAICEVLDAADELYNVKLDNGTELIAASFGDPDWWNMMREEPEYMI